MLYRIFQFEISYRAKRIETYVFFAVVFLFSIIAVNFILEGQDLGQVKENAPLVTAKVMAIVSGIFMLITSMIMGVPILRDFQHQMESLIFVNPITKRDYLMGRFLGSFVVLVFIFSGIIWGVILGEYLPWRSEENLLEFNFWNYLQPFLFLVLPNLFLGASLFFISGTLSRSMIVVYTQGLVFFMVSIFSQNIGNESLASILEPFSYAAIDQVTDLWSSEFRNSKTLPMTGALLYNRLFWTAIGISVLVRGYYLFKYNVVKEQKGKKVNIEKDVKRVEQDLHLGSYTINHDRRKRWLDFSVQSLFYCKSIIKTPSFWAVVGCGVVTIFINSINLGTVHGVNSLPLTYLILEELKEMSLYFFVIIMIFYPGELIWMERHIRMDGIMDALPVSDFSVIAGKFVGLNLVYIVLLLILIVAGVSFQTFNGYYHYDLNGYFVGMFMEVWPFLILFTVLAFFLQVITNSKFIAHIMVIVVFISIMILGLSGWRHGLFAFGGISMPPYSEMNGYGHFLAPFLWFKLYWFAFGFLLFILTVGLSIRGTDSNFLTRWKLLRQKLTPQIRNAGFASLGIFLFVGSYIFYNTNILNKFYSGQSQLAYRAEYETILKKYEYKPQPKIVDIDLYVDLFPKEKSYVVEGSYILVNEQKEPIQQIHIQKALSNDEVLEYVDFSVESKLDKTYEKYGYFIYDLEKPLQTGDFLKIQFKQTSIPKGFEESNNATHIVENGTFFDNDRFPTLGYNDDYELDDKIDRKRNGLEPKSEVAKRNDELELKNGRGGDDGSQINFEMILSTDFGQTAIAPGTLEKSWVEDGRSYFHYKMRSPMINFYSMVSGKYEVLKDTFQGDELSSKPIDLEIYYHKGHERNIHRMMHGMKASLTYYGHNFGEYQYDQLRIMEFPRYANFAQSFPSAIPFSESIGFVLDNEDDDVDVPFYITAHEVAHQWWGLYLVAANVEGRNMILETLAQYSALMVLKKVYGEEKVEQYLEAEKERYEKGRRANSDEEVSLVKVKGQEYLYYGKGAINMYEFQKCISEDKVNLALRNFLNDWNVVDGRLQTDRYPTTLDLMSYFREVTPDSLQYLIKELFE